MLWFLSVSCCCAGEHCWPGMVLWSEAGTYLLWCVTDIELSTILPKAPWEVQWYSSRQEFNQNDTRSTRSNDSENLWSGGFSLSCAGSEWCADWWTLRGIWDYLPCDGQVTVTSPLVGWSARCNDSHVVRNWITNDRSFSLCQQLERRQSESNVHSTGDTWMARMWSQIRGNCT